MIEITLLGYNIWPNAIMLNNLFPNVRPRRLRRNKTIRDLVSETKLLKSKLVQPLFVSESISEKQPLDSMPGQFLFSKDAIFLANFSLSRECI